MEGLRQYAVTVVTAAIVCSIISGISCQDSARSLLRLLSGLILTLTVIRPFAKIEGPSLAQLLPVHMPEAAATAAQGRALAEDTMTDIIKSTCEAYILDKAAGLGADISVSVGVTADRIPVSAAIGGKLSPGAKQRLEEILETDLGIAKENQSWTR